MGVCPLQFPRQVMDVQPHLGQSEDATISQLVFFSPQHVDSVHSLAEVTRATGVLMQSCSAGVFMMASTLDCSEIIIFRTFPVSPPN